jgi:23S rRNA pseudouridine2605 synthase
MALIGEKADASKDKIAVDTRTIGAANPLLYIALHKPHGVLSDRDPEDTRRTVFDMVPFNTHLFAVGRLDLESEGLILLTNDGELANRLTHPRYGHEKEYRVLVATRPDEQQLATWRRGVVLEDGHRTLPAEVRVEELAGKGTWLRIVLREGRKRQIREVGRTLGLPVVKILRIRIGSLELGELKPGEWRELSQPDVAKLKAYGQSKHVPSTGTGAKKRPGAARPYSPTRRSSETPRTSPPRPYSPVRKGSETSRTSPSTRKPSTFKKSKRPV